MRKGLTIAGLLFIILIVSSETVLPWLVRGMVTAKLTKHVVSEDMQVAIGSVPSARLLLGDIQTLDAVLHQAKVGQIYVKELTLTGKNIRINMPALFHEEGLQVDHADELKLKGIVDEENLREVLQRQIDKIENVQVNINRERVLVTANAKIFGRMADIEMEGQVMEDGGSLFFCMTRLDIKNTRIGTARLGDLFGNIQLVSFDKMPMGMKIRQAEQIDGAVVVTAERDNKE